jgi:hypothetical protein
MPMNASIRDQAEQRLLARRHVEYSPDPDPCWVYMGARGHFGYGEITIKRKQWKAHRLAWEVWRGPIPDGKWVLHRCDNPPCFNPRHLFLGNQTINQRDSSAKGRTRNGSILKTHCPRGHPYAETDYGYDWARVCRICKQEQNSRWYRAHGGAEGRRQRKQAKPPPVSD